MRLIDAEGSELQTQLKIIREAEYQIYGSGSWGFTAKCEHAIEDASTITPEPHWIPVTERLPEVNGCYLVSVKNDHERRYSKTAWFEKGVWFARQDVIAWMPLPESYKEVAE